MGVEVRKLGGSGEILKFEEQDEILGHVHHDWTDMRLVKERRLGW